MPLDDSNATHDPNVLYRRRVNATVARDQDEMTSIYDANLTEVDEDDGVSRVQPRRLVSVSTPMTALFGVRVFHSGYTAGRALQQLDGLSSMYGNQRVPDRADGARRAARYQDGNDENA